MPPKTVTIEGVSRYLRSKPGKELLQRHTYEPEHGSIIRFRGKSINDPLSNHAGSLRIWKEKPDELEVLHGYTDGDFIRFARELSRRLKLKLYVPSADN